MQREDRSEERIWIGRAATGDAVAFAWLYGRYRLRVFGFLVRRVECAAEAEDLTQETFVIAYRVLVSFEGRSSFSSWLLGIANNVCRRSARQASRWMIGANRIDLIDKLSEHAQEGIERRVEARRTLARCESLLETSLSETQQEIFRLHYGESQSIRAIAGSLGKSNDAVKASLRRTRSMLIRRVPALEANRELSATNDSSS